MSGNKKKFDSEVKSLQIETGARRNSDVFLLFPFPFPLSPCRTFNHKNRLRIVRKKVIMGLG